MFRVCLTLARTEVMQITVWPDFCRYTPSYRSGMHASGCPPALFPEPGLKPARHRPGEATESRKGRLRMCLAIPGKLIEKTDHDGVLVGRVQFGGIVRDACLDFMPEVVVG